MFKSILITIAFSFMMLLSACSHDSPTDSDIQSQITNLYHCQDVTISNFQKNNGYLQTDGSYLEDVQYTVTYTPSSQMLNIFNDYNVKKQKLTSQNISDNTTMKAAYAQMDVFKCNQNYAAAIITLQKNLNQIPKPYDLDFVGADMTGEVYPDNDSQIIDQDISYLNNNINADQSNSNQSALSVDKNTMISLQNIKSELNTIINTYSVCHAQQLKIAHANEAPFIRMNAFQDNMRDLDNQTTPVLENQLYQECPTTFSSDSNSYGLQTNFLHAEDYATTTGNSIRATLHFVNSDNGWVIQPN